MRMKERLNVILKAAVEAYVDSGEPVSSKLILSRSALEVSSATVRNDLAELEREGYLEQPHTSAGRVPTEKGYRYYVDHLLQTAILPVERATSIEAALEDPTGNVDEFLKHALSRFSEITGYTAAAVMAHSDEDRIIKVELVKTADNCLNLVAITKSGTVKNSFCRFYFLADDSEIASLSELLNRFLGDVSFTRLTDEDFAVLEEQITAFHQNWNFLAGVVKNMVDSIRNPKVFVSGQSNLLSHPEFYEVHKVQNVMRFLSHEEEIRSLLSKQEGEVLSIAIGSEIAGINFSDMGLIVRKYGSKSGFGAISLLGPKRMDYGANASQVEYFAKCIEQYLKDREGS
ncbi:MAG: heat-inducible transcription repressor HrcA [Clostridia bacterium]|nr:heat-inducible transcription repressor HrcA [Clostridia bacterium]